MRLFGTHNNPYDFKLFPIWLYLAPCSVSVLLGIAQMTAIALWWREVGGRVRSVLLEGERDGGRERKTERQRERGRERERGFSL